MNRISILILFLTCFAFSKDIEAQAVKVPFTEEIIKEYGLNEEWKLKKVQFFTSRSIRMFDGVNKIVIKAGSKCKFHGYNSTGEMLVKFEKYENNSLPFKADNGNRYTLSANWDKPIGPSRIGPYIKFGQKTMEVDMNWNPRGCYLTVKLKPSKKGGDDSDSFPIQYEQAPLVKEDNSFYESPSPKPLFTISDSHTAPNNDLEKRIKSYVEMKINSWQQKGEFEKTQEFKLRVNEKTRNLEIQKYQEEAIQFLKKEHSESIDYDKLELKEYDADNETFLLKSIELGEFAVAVDIKNAPSFKRNFHSCEFKNADFILVKNRFILSSLTMSNVLSSGKKEFVYNSNAKVNYEPIKIEYNFSDIELNVSGRTTSTINPANQTKTISIGQSDVDVDIPSTSSKQAYTYALIIGNEDYSTYQTDLSSEVNVDYAINDAQVFKTYCTKTLGIPEKQIRLLTNATYGQMSQSIEWIKRMADVEGGQAKLIFYYSGHGFPDEQTKQGYLIPVDVSGNNVENGISLKKVYQSLNEFPADRVTVFLDACFSGGARNEALVAMKVLKIRPKEEDVSGNMVVFSSSSGNESSAVYREKQHGYFTYFLLKKLQESKGDVDYKTLNTYLNYQVKKATGLSGKIQNPQCQFSNEIESQWENWKLK